MEISQWMLARLSLYSCFLGIGLGAFYDVLRITRVFFGVHYSRKTAKRLREIRLPWLSPQKPRTESRWLGLTVFLEDFFFGLLSCVSLILLFYGANNGKFRFLAVLCTAGGFLLYRLTVGKIVMLFSEWIAFALGTALRYLGFVLSWPIKQIRKRVRSLASAIRRRAAAFLDRKARKRATEKAFLQAARSACGTVPAAPENRKWKWGRGIHAERKEKAVQSESVDPRVSRRSRSRVHSDLCHERDAVQRITKRRKRTSENRE